ncbi:SIMPL domain-containing protein [Massilia sp. H6]|uniref:SIMPL domain-containing protein n=1 Tax=Massilia sp. H6 TaxID=2970464 RepID=UPI00216A8BFB|nr:SIMPL domain-containing protein [Massilia sp. H6]UVW28024.1 SIMPL domain-containing protein [Massilia sp. H6]
MLTRLLTHLGAALLLAATALPCLGADLPSYPFIHVSAAASIGMRPDTGEIDFEIVSADADADSAWQQVTQQLEASRALFASHGIAPDDVNVQDILRRSRKTEVAGDAAPQMDTRVALKVTVRNMEAWSAMMRSLMAMPKVESLAVAFSRSDRDKIEAELVTKALANARGKAQNMARGIGARLGAASGVSLGALKNLSNSMGMALEPNGRYTDGGPDAATDLTLVAAITLVQGVDVIYRIGR